MEGLCDKFLCGEPQRTCESLWPKACDGHLDFAPRQMPRFMHVQNYKVLKWRHEKQGMFPEIMSWIGSFFRVRQLMNCSCSSATGQQQGEKLSLVHTLREQLLEMRRGEMSSQQSKWVAGQGRVALRHPDCHLKIYMKQIDRFLAWEEQMYIKTCSCAHAFLCFSYRKDSERAGLRPMLVPFTAASWGSFWGKREERNLFLFAEVHSGLLNSPLVNLWHKQTCTKPQCAQDRSNNNYWIKGTNEIQSSWSTFMHFLCVHMWEGVCCRGFCSHAFSFPWNKSVCKVHPFPEEYITA